MTPPPQTPAKRQTRTESKLTAQSLANQLKAKVKLYASQITRLQADIEDPETLSQWSKGNLNERVIRIGELSKQIDDAHIEAVCELDPETADEIRSTNDVSMLIMSLKAKLFDRLEALNQAEGGNQPQTTKKQEPYQIEVLQTDPTGNVPNTWGTFDGDYSKWRSFHDRWMAAMHRNKKVKTIIKFQNLQKACIGAAEGALGEWDLTDENYEKAWKRLRSIYENDYMQVQTFMRLLAEIPPMRDSSSKTIRDVIDAAQKHIHGLARYIVLGEKHPYVVFTIISKMDTGTYRAWEKHRAVLAKSSVSNANDNRPGKHIPTWDELGQFLENEVTIRVHAEKRSGTHNQEAEANNKKDLPEFLQCVLCDEIHPIYRCNNFKAMDRTDRLNHVSKHDLCIKCLRKNHTGECVAEKCNEECPRCWPENELHNSMLCPNNLNIKSRKRNSSSDEESV